MSGSLSGTRGKVCSERWKGGGISGRGGIQFLVGLKIWEGLSVMVSHFGYKIG